MTSFVVSTTVRRPVEVVVAALLDAENFVYWTTHLERFEVVSGVPGEVGAVGRLHYLENDRRYVMEDRLVVAEPGRCYVSRVSGDVIEAMVETSLTAVDDGTRVTMRWSGRGKVFPLRLILPPEDDPPGPRGTRDPEKADRGPRRAVRSLMLMPAAAAVG